MKKITIFKTEFYEISFTEIQEICFSQGGIIVAPAAPALAEIPSNPTYHQAIQGSKIAIFDSVLLKILVLIFKGINFKKYSGLSFCRDLIAYLPSQNKRILVVEASEEEAEINHTYFKQKKIIPSNTLTQYIAPIYNKDNIHDLKLINRIQEFSPDIILINIGGLKQEILANKIMTNNLYKRNPVVICTGAAIGFLSGNQVKIPIFIDIIGLGWLARVISNPSVYFKRYLSAMNLIPLFISDLRDS